MEKAYQFKNTILAANIGPEKIFEYCAQKRKQRPEYKHIHEGYIYAAERRAKLDNLRYDRKRNIMRCDSLGWISKPSSPSEWEQATREEAQQYLMQQIWSDAVREFNIENMGA